MAESASATIAVNQLDASHWQYTVTLQDTGSTSIGTFWFAWVPGEDFLASSPGSITAPTGWADIITHAGSGDGYAIQWTASSASSDLQPGGSSSGFSFVSTDAPSSVFGNSVFYPSTPVTTSFVYSGAPFSDAGYQFVATAAAPSLNPAPPANTTADMILRHGADGLYEIYDIGGNSLLAAYQLGQVGTDWQFVGLGGFNGSDTTDMLLRSASTGAFEVYDVSPS